MRYIALLKGEKDKIREILRDEAFGKVIGANAYQNVTIDDTGILAFDTPITKESILAKHLSSLITKYYQEKMQMVVFKQKAIKKIIKNNPFINEADIVNIAFLSNAPAPLKISKLMENMPKSTKCDIKDRVAYLIDSKQDKVNDELLDSNLGVVSTIQPYPTCLQLTEM